VRVWTVTGLDAPANAWKLAQQFTAYSSGNAGVRIATGDFNGDTVPDIVTAPGTGVSPNVRVFDLALGFTATPTKIGDFKGAANNFKGGIYVAAGDVNGDGVPEVITSEGTGGKAVVRVFNGTTIGHPSPTLLSQFTAYSGFHGEVRVAAVDVHNDGKVEIMTSAGAGASQSVKVWQINTLGTALLFDQYDPYNVGHTGGIYVAGGN
jgi:hypothetical protein